jgi:hypothetical protein
MESAPKAGTPILVWAVWEWYSQTLKPGVYKANPMVCKWEGYYYDDEGDIKGLFFSVTRNPYNDEAVLPIGWLPLQHDYEVEVIV